MDNNISQLEWNGLKSQKFLGSRRHLVETHQSFEVTDKSRKHFTSDRQSIFQKNASEYLLKGKKVFPDQVTRETVPKAFVQKSNDFVPKPKLSKGEMVHLVPSNHGTLEDLSVGIKTYDEANKPSDRNHIVEDQMQRKVQVTSLNSKRNGIGSISSGDKPYGSPEFAQGYFKNSSNLSSRIIQ